MHAVMHMNEGTLSGPKKILDACVQDFVIYRSDAVILTIYN